MLNRFYWYSFSGSLCALDSLAGQQQVPVFILIHVCVWFMEQFGKCCYGSIWKMSTNIFKATIPKHLWPHSISSYTSDWLLLQIKVYPHKNITASIYIHTHICKWYTHINAHNTYTTHMYTYIYMHTIYIHITHLHTHGYIHMYKHNTCT